MQPAVCFGGFNLKHQLIALTLAVFALWWNKFWLLNRHILKVSVLFDCVQWIKVWTVNSCFQCFLQALSGNTFFCSEASGLIFLFYVIDVKCNDFLVESQHYASLIAPSFKNFSCVLSKEEIWQEVSWHKSRLDKNTQSFIIDGLSILQAR